MGIDIVWVFNKCFANLTPVLVHDFFQLQLKWNILKDIDGSFASIFQVFTNFLNPIFLCNLFPIFKIHTVQ